MCGSEAPASRRSLTITCTYAALAWARIRCRHASIAACTCSTGSAPSVTTGCGALTTTSCSPIAGMAVNRSGFAWRIDILPRLTHLAGLELGTGVHLNIVAPEHAAALLRDA